MDQVQRVQHGDQGRTRCISTNTNSSAHVRVTKQVPEHWEKRKFHHSPEPSSLKDNSLHGHQARCFAELFTDSRRCECNSFFVYNCSGSGSYQMRRAPRSLTVSSPRSHRKICREALRGAPDGNQASQTR